jgi:hypothetical protein
MEYRAVIFSGGKERKHSWSISRYYSTSWNRSDELEGLNFQDKKRKSKLKECVVKH